VKAAQNDSRNALARLYQQTGQLEQAAVQYQSYAQANPKDQKAIDAYFNAAVLMDSVGRQSDALQNYQAYFTHSQRPDRVDVLFAQAEIHRKQGANTKAIALYDQYLKSRPTSSGRAIQSAFWIGRLAEKDGRHSLAEQWYRTTLDMHHKSGRGTSEAVKYAAEAKFRLSQATVSEISSIHFGTSDKQQAQAAARLKTLRDRYIADMKEVIRFDNAEFIVAALASTGQMFEAMANTFARIPVPQGLSGEDAQKYRELIQQQVNGFKAEAKSSYKTALDKALELESFGPWTMVARNGLASYDSAAAGNYGDEVVSESRAADWMGL
jgi:tetratricopeptide (TPR) repeat protein